MNISRNSREFFDSSSLQEVMSSSLVEFISGIPDALLKQYEYEEARVRTHGDQLMHSAFLRVSFFPSFPYCFSLLSKFVRPTPLIKQRFAAYLYLKG